MNQEGKRGIFTDNDYELLYMINEHSDEAMEIMCEKYRFLIYMRMKRFNVYASLRDDFLQEGYLVLQKAIHKYLDTSPMSFTNFFDLLLQRRFITLIHQYTEKQKRVCFDETLINELCFEEKRDFYGEIYIPENLSKLEKRIFQMKVKDGLKAEEIARRLKLSSKQVYNTISRMKRKIKEKNKKME